MKMSKWWKIDFHVHTPASKDYKENDVTPESWLKAAMEQELDAVVVADHNSGEWIDKLYAAYDKMKRENAEGFRELTVFPGFELSVAGEPNRYHLLCVLDPIKRTRNLTACLGECGIRDGFGDEEHVSTLRGIEDIVQSVCNHGGLLIPAHINGDKGLIGNRTTLTPDLEKALNYFVAAEFCTPPAYTDGKMKHAVKRLAILGGSDAHVTRMDSVSGGEHRHSWIGKHYVWVKMGNPTIDALRMALSDPLDCVRTDGPAPEVDFRLLNMSAKNLMDATNVPYCEDFECSFSPAMTAFIGGRGTGKSTVARCIRDVFCRPPESSEESEINRQWQSYRESTSDSILTVEFLMLGRRYRLTKHGHSEERLEEYGDDGWVEAALGDVKSRFPISVFGQKEVGELASRPYGLLALIDEAGDTKGGGWKDEWDRCVSEYLSLKIRERELEQQVELLPAIKVELTDVERNILDYERMGGGNVLKTFQCRSRQDAAMSVPDVIGGTQGWAAQIRALADKFVVPDFPSELFADDDSTLDEIKSVYGMYAKKLKGLCSALENCANEVDAIIGEYQTACDVTAWRQAHKAAISAYKELCAQNGGELHIEDYGSWVTKRNHLVERVQTLEAGEIELAKTRSDAVMDQKKLEDLRESLRKKRQEFIDGTLRSNSLVKMTVRKFADRSHVESRLRKVLNVSSEWQTPAITEMLSAIMKWDPDRNADAELALRVSELKDKIHKVVMGADSVTVWFDRKAKELWATNPSAFDEFDVWWPEDHVEVEYSMDDGGGFRPLSAGASAGQKATAMLAFLLSYGTNPILIDQPEDDIDNRLITKLLVQQLRDNKNRRQVIVMTHNPNVVVNGGAESVTVMNFSNGKVMCECQGPIDCSEIKKASCDIMEGGQEAFRKRYDRELGDVE